MEKILVIAFDNEARAYAGVHALEELDLNGDVALDKVAIVVKNPDGSSSPAKGWGHGEHLGTITGGFVGALVGTLGGFFGIVGVPMGIGIGMAGGALIGSIGDREDVAAEKTFESDIANALAPGQAAVIADVMEESVEPVDTRMSGLGGTVSRWTPYEIGTCSEEREAAIHNAEIERLKAERAAAHQDRWEKLDSQISELRNRIEPSAERRRINAEARTRERERKILALEAKAARAEGELRDRQSARIDELRSAIAAGRQINGSKDEET